MSKVTVPPIKRGLNIPITGAPEARVVDGPNLQQVGLLGDDYIGMKPTMNVAEGDRVKVGQLLFEDKKTPGVKYTSPASGKVLGVNRGAKRKFESIVIEVDGEEAETFESYPDTNLHSLERDKTKANLFTIQCRKGIKKICCIETRFNWRTSIFNKQGFLSLFLLRIIGLYRQKIRFHDQAHTTEFLV